MSTKNRSAPSCANASAMARPIPLAAPVTSARFPRIVFIDKVSIIPRYQWLQNLVGLAVCFVQTEIRSSGTDPILRTLVEPHHRSPREQAQARVMECGRTLFEAASGNDGCGLG
jgi:hypothetical protein